MKSLNFLPILVAITALCIATPAFSQEDPHVACRGDEKTFCMGVSPGRGGIADCLKQHEKELSANCLDAIKKHEELRGKPLSAQGGDAPHPPPPGGHDGPPRSGVNDGPPPRGDNGMPPPEKYGAPVDSGQQN